MGTHFENGNDLDCISILKKLVGKKRNHSLLVNTEVYMFLFPSGCDLTFLSFNVHSQIYVSLSLYLLYRLLLNG